MHERGFALGHTQTAANSEHSSGTGHFLSPSCILTIDIGTITSPIHRQGKTKAQRGEVTRPRSHSW